MTSPNNRRTYTELVGISKAQLDESLKSLVYDDVLINGILNFARTKLVSLIIGDINVTFKKSVDAQPMTEISGAQTVECSKCETAEELIDRVWTEFHHPVLKYYKSIHQEFEKQEAAGHRRTVEIRKLNTAFRKTIKPMRDFYFNILKQILTQHELSFIIPEPIYDLFDLEVDPSAFVIKKSDNVLIVKLIYVVHRCILFMGAISRYRSMLSKYLPKSEQESDEKALKYCRYAELLLPAFGEARNYIAMMYLTQGKTLLSAYEFLRSGFSRIPSNYGISNFESLLTKPKLIIDDLNKLRLEENHTGELQQKYVSVLFLSILGYYYAPDQWKRSSNRLINGCSIQELKQDLFKSFTQRTKNPESVFLFEKELVLLIGTFEILNPSKAKVSEMPKLNGLMSFIVEFFSTIETTFVENWSDDLRGSGFDFLPTIRIMFSWLRVNKSALQYIHRNPRFVKCTATLLNTIYAGYSDCSTGKKVTRTQYFMEDVGMKEFTPIDRMLWDFDDSGIFHSADAPLRLIGRFAEHDDYEENKLRLKAVGFLGKRLMLANRVGAVFDEEKRVFDISKVKEAKSDASKVQSKPLTIRESLVKKKEAQKSNGKLPQAKENTRKNKSKKSDRKATTKVTPKDKERPQSNTANRVIPFPDAVDLPSTTLLSSAQSSDIVEISQTAFDDLKGQSTHYKFEHSTSEKQNTVYSSKREQSYASMVDFLVQDNVKSGNSIANSSTLDATPAVSSQSQFNLPWLGVTPTSLPVTQYGFPANNYPLQKVYQQEQQSPQSPFIVPSSPQPPFQHFQQHQAPQYQSPSQYLQYQRLHNIYQNQVQVQSPLQPTSTSQPFHYQPVEQVQATPTQDYRMQQNGSFNAN